MYSMDNQSVYSDMDRNKETENDVKNYEHSVTINFDTKTVHNPNVSNEIIINDLVISPDNAQKFCDTGQLEGFNDQIESYIDKKSNGAHTNTFCIESRIDIADEVTRNEIAYENKEIGNDILNNSNEEKSGKINNDGRKFEVSAENILDSKALAMFKQNTANKPLKTVQESDASSQKLESMRLLTENSLSMKLQGVKVDPSSKNMSVGLLEKKSSDHGLVGVISTGLKSKKQASKKFGVLAKHVTKIPDKVIYARNNRCGVFGSRIPVTGGTPITEALAMELRTVAFGSSGCPPRGEWIRTPLMLRPAGQPLAYGLTAPRNGCRGLLTALGAHILKHLLFGSERPKDAQGKLMQTDLLLRPDEGRQQEALILAISEVIWRASGDTKKAFITIPQDMVYVQHSHAYYQDNVTEKLHIFEMHNLEDVQIFVKRYLYLFDEEPGCGAVLLLYSCMLTRGLQNIKKDLDEKYNYLLSSQTEGSISVVMLILTGRATPYLHNGVIYVGDEDHYALPQYGVLARSSIGLLEWRGSEEQRDNERQPPGSRLKTPALPIWVTFYAGHYGMLFNTNRELLRNYHAERRFDLQYYTCGGCYVFLSVDTRALNDAGTSSKDDINATPLEKLIHSKWQDAKVTWTGQTPYVGENNIN